MLIKKKKKMENTVDKEIVLISEPAIVSTTNTMTENNSPKEKISDSTSMLTTETNDKPVDNCETISATNKSALVDSIDNNLSVDDELNSAMASAKISTPDASEIKQIQDESTLNEKPLHELTTIQNENNVPSSNEKSDISVITSEPNDDINSTNTSEFHECIDEDGSVEKSLLNDSKDCDEKYFSDEKTILDLEKSEEVIYNLKF